MKHYELLRLCADRLESAQNRLEGLSPADVGVVLTHPHGTGRFPFVGGGTEKLCYARGADNYFVPIHRILSGLAKGIKTSVRA